MTQQPIQGNAALYLFAAQQQNGGIGSGRLSGSPPPAAAPPPQTAPAPPPRGSGPRPRRRGRPTTGGPRIVRVPARRVSSIEAISPRSERAAISIGPPATTAQIVVDGQVCTFRLK